jgi:hypothetical protein
VSGKGDPNEIVCEKFKVIGSRLATKTACATRQEWADRRLTDRQNVEKSQLGPCVVTGQSRRC